MDQPKRILIVDDINDTGATLNWICEDWPSGCFPDDARWTEVWGNNVRVACLYDNESSKSKLDIAYSAVTINKADKDVWIVFPWEAWWQK
jgi:hypoxanthine phosphoribosyltransferase